MRIPSGVTDQYVYFIAVDSTDFATRETGLSGFTVYRSRNGAAAASFTTPTVNETDATNMPGVYELLLDEDTTIAAGNDSEEMVLHITVAGMAPVTRTIELYRPKITEGNTLDVTATGAAGIDWGNIENKTTANDLSATDIQLVDTVTTYTGNTVQTGDSFARIGAAGAGLTEAGGTGDHLTACLTATGFATPTNITSASGVSLAADQSAVTIGTVTDVTNLHASAATAAALTTVDNEIAALQATADAIETDTQNIQTRIPAALNNGTMPVDVQRINDVAVTGDGSTTPFDV